MLLHESGLSYQRTEKVYRSRPDAQTVADFMDAYTPLGLGTF